MKNITCKKIIYMILGIVLIGINVGFCRMAGLGVDPFSCMDLGISTFLQKVGLSFMTFGTWQLIMNCMLLVLVFFTMRHFIGIGTFANMILVGYVADFTYWLLHTVCRVPVGADLITYWSDRIGSSSGLCIGWGCRVAFLLGGLLLISMGAAMYMAVDLGVSPYDCVAFIIEKYSKGKISFKYGRICSDVLCVMIGIVFCAMSGNSVLLVVGVGTVVNAFLNGPFIQFFRVGFEKIVKS